MRILSIPWVKYSVGAIFYIALTWAIYKMLWGYFDPE